MIPGNSLPQDTCSLFRKRFEEWQLAVGLQVILNLQWIEIIQLSNVNYISSLLHSEPICVGKWKLRVKNNESSILVWECASLSFAALSFVICTYGAIDIYKVTSSSLFPIYTHSAQGAEQSYMQWTQYFMVNVPFFMRIC